MKFILLAASTLALSLPFVSTDPKSVWNYCTTNTECDPARAGKCKYLILTIETRCASIKITNSTNQLNLDTNIITALNNVF